jgi:hypothetical protein
MDRRMRCAAAATALLCACFSPELEDGAQCSPDGECPEGQTCAEDGLCYASAPTFRFQRRIDIHPLSLSAIVRDYPLAVLLEDDAALAEHAADDGADIHFTEADGETELDFEIERFDGEDGDLTAWVRVPVLSFEDTIILHYGGDPVERPDRDTVWADGYVAVWHGGGADPTELLDSTGGSSDGESSGDQVPDRVDGVAGTALSFDGVDDLVTIDPQVTLFPAAIGDGGNAGEDGAATVTVSLWVKVTETVGDRDAPLAVGELEENQAGFGFLLGTGAWEVHLTGDGDISQGSATSQLGESGLYLGRWVLLSARISAEFHNPEVYLQRDPAVDTVAVDSDFYYCETTCAYDVSDSAIFLSHPDARFRGLLDEIRVHTGAISAADLALQFENLSSRNSFYTVGPEEPVAR